MWIVRAATRLAPPNSMLRDADVETAVADVWSAGYARGGAVVALTASVRECVNLAVASVGARLGRGPRISGGQSPRRSERKHGMAHLVRDLRAALRTLLGTPSHTALVTLTLALGIGINAAVFSVVDSMLIRPVPFAEQDRLVSLWTYTGKFSWRGGFTSPLIREWRAQTDLFDRVEASQEKTFVFEHDDGAELVTGSIVTPGLFSTLGVQPSRGRLFVDGDGRDGSDRLAVVSARFWSQQMNGVADVIGREILLDGDRYQIVGVVPDAFRYPDEQHVVWVPVDPARPPSTITRPASFVPLARLAPGVTPEQARERVSARGADLNARAGGDGKATASVMPLSDFLRDREERSLLVLAGSVGFLLLIVCANIANLTLSRALTRTRDLAVRAALGASRADLMREALLEHALVGIAGAAGGLIVAALSIAAITAVLPEAMTMSSLNRIDIDVRTLGFLAAASVVTVLLFGLPPALMAGRIGVAGLLQGQSRSATGSILARRLRSGLVVAEVALSIVLLVGAALMTRSLMKLEAIDVGMNVDGLLAMQIALPAGPYADASVRDTFTTELIARLKTQRNVVNASMGALPPRESLINVGAIELADRPGEKTKSSVVPVFEIWPGYFDTAGIRVVDGREPQPTDPVGAAVVSQGFAAKHWPQQSALGRQFKIGKGPWRTVVGVSSEVRRRSEDDDSAEFEIYYPRGQTTDAYVATRPVARIAEYRTMLVRTTGTGVSLQQLAGVVHQIDPRVIVGRTSLVEREFADAIARPRVVFLMLVVFAGFGLVLAAAGLYGVLSYLVSQRLREIGIRLALGARPADIRRLIFGAGLTMAGVGLAIGIGAALLLVRLMRTLLYEVEPTDPASVAAVAGLLLATAALAAWRPARRAMRVDPVNLLRE